jgi:GntR family transcriptional regulator, transcriptional repressor for pyruvate dehydrogenase complex
MLENAMVWLKRDAMLLSVPPQQRTEVPAPGPQVLPAGSTVEPAGAAIQLRLRRLIEQGGYTPGAKLPPERVLANELSVGRPSLREAIKVLSGCGVLESRRGSGTYVKASAPQAAPAASGLDGETGEFGMLDLLEARRIVEPRAAWLAATRASEAHLREIESARQQLEMHDRDWKLAGRLDIELHAAIVRGAQNPVLDPMHRFLVTRLLALQATNVRFVPDVERLRRDHRAIVEAILQRQADAAEKAMIAHLNAGGLDFITEPAR